MERTNNKASRLISGDSLTGDHSRDDFIFLVLARNYTGGNPSLDERPIFNDSFKSPRQWPKKKR